MAMSAVVTDVVLFTARKADGTTFVVPRGLLDPALPLDTLKAQAEGYINPSFESEGKHFRVFIRSADPIDFVVWAGPLDQEPDDGWLSNDT